MAIRVLVWNEFQHEKTDPKVRSLYPEGIHQALAKHLSACDGVTVTTGTLDDPEQGLSEAALAQTDVILWWGHKAHGAVLDAHVDRVYTRVMEGMGLICLHSGHFSKIFKRLMGTSCDLKWRVQENEREILWVTRPGHPIVKDIDDYFILEQEEMYGEFFDVPEPDETILISSFTGGEVFRSGITYRRGAGRIFYFRPGHETFPSFYNKNVIKVIENAIHWAAPSPGRKPHTFGHRKSGWLHGAQ
jgi:trehalose utilization protein